MPDLTQLLRELTGQVTDPQFNGPAGNLPRPLRAGLGLLPAARLGLQGVPGMEQDQQAARALTGALLIANARVNPAFGLFPDAPGAQMARRAQAGATGPNPFAAALAANEAAAAGGAPLQVGPLHTTSNAVGAGLVNSATDPLNLLGPAGKAAEAAKLERLATLLNAADFAQNLPVEALRPLARRGIGAVRGAAARRLAREVTGNVAAEALPVVGGKRQLGPIMPPEQFGYAKGNVPGKPRLGPELLPSQDVPLPPELGPALPTRGNVPADQLVPKVGRSGDKGLGPLLPPEVGPPAPATPAATQPVVDLLNAARKSAQPNPLEQLVGAGRGTAAREITPRRTLAQIEAAVPQATAQLPLPGSGGREIPQNISALTDVPAPEPAALDFSDRAGTIRAVANAPVEHLNNVLRDLHNAVYPGQQADFAIPALTGQPRAGFRTSTLTDHPGGNAAEPYLDYMISRVQKDKKAAARLADINPQLADDVSMVAENPLPLAEHKRLVQALFGVGPQGADVPTPVAAVPSPSAPPAAPTGTLDDVRALILDHAQQFNTRYPPLDPAFYARRANVDPAQVPAMLDQLVREGTLGRLPDGALAVKLGAGAAPDSVLRNSELASAADNITAQTPLSNVDIPPSVAGATPNVADVAAATPGIVELDGKRYRPDPADPQFSWQMEYKGKWTPVRSLAIKDALMGRERVAATPLGEWEQAYRAAQDRLGRENPGMPYHELEQAAQEEAARFTNAPKPAGGDLVAGGGALPPAVPVPDTAALKAEFDRLAAAFRAASPEQRPALMRPMKDAAAAYNAAREAEIGTAAFRKEGTDQMGTGMANALAPLKKAFGVAEDAAGGGGFGLLPFRGGLGAANRAVGGALAGGAAGGVAGALASPDDRLGGAAKGAAAGALLGGNLGAGAGLLESRLARGATAGAGHPLLAHAWERGQVEQAAANAASGNLWSALKNLPAVWRRNVTEHPRNLAGDEGWGRTVLQGAQGAGSQRLLRQVRDEAAQRLDAATPWERLPQTTQAAMAALGRAGQVPDLGGSFHNAEGNLTRRVISTSDQMIGSGILSLANPAAVAQNVVGAAGSVALGSQRPRWHGFFQAVNGFQQETFRQAAFADEAATGLRLAAERFLPDLRAAGVDISRLAPDGSFGVADVHNVAGQAAADRWRAYGDAIYDSATKRVKFLFGDYSKRSGVERALGGPIPFASWVIRAYPVALSLLAQHPAAALAAYHYMRLTSAGAGKDGRPGYTAGMIPADQDTPILGALVRLYTQGEGGRGYIDPIGGISPVGGDMFAPAEDNTGKNWYQQGTALLSRLGLPGPNPAIQAGAYVAGLDYKAPGALSRTQGLENYAALLPGNPALPDVAGGLLRAARGAVSPATAAAGLPGAQADKTPVAYDPITRRYAELWYAKTGKTLNDPSDPSGLLAMGDPANPLMQQARREVLTAGAVKNVGSLTSPVGVIGQSGENAAYRAAQVGEPFSAARIAGSSPGVGQLMQAGNQQYRQATPASQIYTVGNREQGAYALLDQFDADPQVLWMKQYAPKSYQMRRDELMIRLGLKAPPKPARQNPYLPPGR